MELGLADSTVLVTGSSRGIGRGIAETFAREGAGVVLTGRDTTVLQQTATSMAESFGDDKIFFFPGDLSDDGTLEACANFVRDLGLDHLVCNVGSGRSVPVLQEDAAEFQRMLEINLLSAQRSVAALLPLLTANAARGRNTTITFVSSICGCEVLGCPTAYAAAKSALNTYAKTIARPLGAKGVRVNLVSPGNVLFPDSTWEDKLAADKGAVQAMLEREVPLARLGTLDEVADVVAFLASARASFVTGANWIVDGGQVRSL